MKGTIKYEKMLHRSRAPVAEHQEYNMKRHARVEQDREARDSSGWQWRECTAEKKAMRMRGENCIYIVGREESERARLSYAIHTVLIEFYEQSYSTTAW